MTDKLKWVLDVGNIKDAADGKETGIVDIILGGHSGAILARAGNDKATELNAAKREALRNAIYKLNVMVAEMNLELSKLQGV